MYPQQDTQTVEVRQRPCGVMLMSAFLFIQGIFQMIAGIFGLLGLIVLVFDFSRGGALLTHGAIMFILGILSIVFSIGLLTLKRWAFWGVVIVAAFNLITSLTVLIQTGFVSFGQFLVVVLSLAILLYFLADTNVRAAFRT
jgi:hypothetical protein